jgi:hypothetical protein
MCFTPSRSRGDQAAKLAHSGPDSRVTFVMKLGLSAQLTGADLVAE